MHHLLRYLGYGHGFEPLTPEDQVLLDREFTIGHVYRLEQAGEVSDKSRSQYFAALRLAWENLPENIKERFPTERRLRAWLLMQAGFCNTSDIVCADHRAAMRAVRDMSVNEYMVFEVRGNVVTLYATKSMNADSMKTREFQDAKEKTLGILGKLLGIDPLELLERGK